jgi:hypothetical protein
MHAQKVPRSEALTLTSLLDPHLTYFTLMPLLCPARSPHCLDTDCFVCPAPALDSFCTCGCSLTIIPFLVPFLFILPCKSKLKTLNPINPCSGDWEGIRDGVVRRLGDSGPSDLTGGVGQVCACNKTRGRPAASFYPSHPPSSPPLSSTTLPSATTRRMRVMQGRHLPTCTCQHVLGGLLQCRHFTHEARGGGHGRCGRVDVGAVHSCSLEVRAVHSFHLPRSHLSVQCIFIIFKCVFCVCICAMWRRAPWVPFLP